MKTTVIVVLLILSIIATTTHFYNNSKPSAEEITKILSLKRFYEQAAIENPAK